MGIKLIQNRIHDLRGHKVMLDFDIADLYETGTKRLNEQVKRNLLRFPSDFMFRLTTKEWLSMRSQFATAYQHKRNDKQTPYAFTEHGVAMLASVLKSKKAVQMNISIIRAFIALREFALNYKKLADQIKEIKRSVANHAEQLNKIYTVIENMIHDKAEQKAWKERVRIGFRK